MNDRETLLGVADVARMLGVCPRSVWQYSQDGLIPRPVKLGGRRLWLPAPLAEALARLHEAAQRPDSKGDQP